MAKRQLSYTKSGVNYQSIDPIKKMAQKAALSTAAHLRKAGYKEITDSRGESAYVWQQGNVYMASVVEGLGTKNLIADQLEGKKSYYDVIAHDTVASIINDLVSVGAKPLTIHAYWATGSSHWLENKKRMAALIRGWKKACDTSKVSWGGGETPTLKGILYPNTIDLGGSAVGVIQNRKQLLLDTNIRAGDAIIFIQSSGVNMNGLTLARAVAKKLPRGYSSKLPSGKTYGETLLTKANIYAPLINNIFKAGIHLHYISNITGHGLRKVMRAKQKFSYVIKNVFKPQEIFTFIQKHSGLGDYEMYETFNMGQDYALFIAPKDVQKTLQVIQKNGFIGIDAGRVERGKKQVVLQPKKITFTASSLNVR